MQITEAHRELARKFMFQQDKDDFTPIDSMINLVAFAYTEEEAEIVNHLGFRPRKAESIAARVKRPLNEVEPILKSLGDRFLILSLSLKKGVYYGFMPLVPGVFELQVISSKGRNDKYYRDFAVLFEQFYDEIGDWLRPRLEDRDPQFMRVVPIEKSLDADPAVNVIAYPTDKFSEMVDRNSSFCILNCPCRTAAELAGKGCGKPKDVCSAMGWVADLVVEKGLGRRVDKLEYLETKARAADAGLVNLVDNMQDPLQVCSCCGCCCGVLRIANQHNMPRIFTKSHFEASVDADTCSGCGTCVDWCPMKAITLENDTACVDTMRCIGCGVCATKCDTGAISLREREDYSMPARSVVDFAVNRYLEARNINKRSFLPRLSLGVGRLLSGFVQPYVAGPRYKK